MVAATLVATLLVGARPARSAEVVDRFEIGPQGSVVLSLGDDGSRVLALRRGNRTKFGTIDDVREIHDRTTGGVFRVPDGATVSSDETAVAVAVHPTPADDTTITVTDAATGATVSRTIPQSARLGDPAVLQLGRAGRRAAVSFALPDQGPFTRVVWVDTATGEAVELPLDGALVADLSPAGRYVAAWQRACVGTDRGIRCGGVGWIYDMESGSQPRRFVADDLALGASPVVVGDEGTYVVADAAKDPAVSLVAGVLSDDFRVALVHIGSQLYARDLEAGGEMLVPDGSVLSGNGRSIAFAEEDGPIMNAVVVTADLRPQTFYAPARSRVLMPLGANIVNVTVAGPEGTGYFSLADCLADIEPPTSLVNYALGGAAANLSLENRGQCGYSQWGVDLVVDAVGDYVANVFDGLRAGGRLLDTRDAASSTAGRRLPADGVLHLPLADAVAPTSSALAVNLTVTDALADGFATLWPCDAERPPTSNVNFRAGQTVANAAVVPIRPGVDLCVSTRVPAHVVIDVVEAYGAGVIVGPTQPTRLLDTRVPGARSPLLRAGDEVRYPLSLPAGQIALVHVTAVNATEAGWVSTDCGIDEPTSTVNPVDAHPVANLTLVDPAAGQPCLVTHGPVDVVVDLQAVFAPYRVAVHRTRLLDSRLRPAPLVVRGAAG